MAAAWPSPVQPAGLGVSSCESLHQSVLVYGELNPEAEACDATTRQLMVEQGRLCKCYEGASFFTHGVALQIRSGEWYTSLSQCNLFLHKVDTAVASTITGTLGACCFSPLQFDGAKCASAGQRIESMDKKLRIHAFTCRNTRHCAQTQFWQQAGQTSSQYSCRQPGTCPGLPYSACNSPL